MHPAIEAVLFDPELELGKALGPVKTEAGWHLIWARSKIRGILSMTVRANHILIKPGWHEPPAEEESLALAPQLAGEEGNIFQTWRQWSFALSLPPVQNSDEEMELENLSFQEYLFVDVLCGEESSCTSKAHSFGASDEQLSVSMNDPFYRNAMSLGRGHLGRTFAMQRPAWNFDCQPRLAPLGRVALRHLLAGAVALRSLDLSSVGFSTPSDVATLAEAAALAGLPALEELSMRCCQLPASAAGALGSLLAQAPRLARLDLECNRDLLRTPEAVASLTDALGDRRLASLTRLSLRWCQVPAAVSLSLGALLARCCPKLVEVDLLGCRQLRHSDIATSLPPTVKLKGLAAAC